MSRGEVSRGAEDSRAGTGTDGRGVCLERGEPAGRRETCRASKDDSKPTTSCGRRVYSFDDATQGIYSHSLTHPHTHPLPSTRLPSATTTAIPAPLACLLFFFFLSVHCYPL